MIGIPMRTVGAHSIESLIQDTNKVKGSLNSNLDEHKIKDNTLHIDTSRSKVLIKGQKQSLNAIKGDLDNISVCMGWDTCNNETYDLDSEAFMLDNQDRVIGDDWFVFYNQTESPDGALHHTVIKDKSVHAGYNESINIKLSKLDTRVSKIVFVITINDAKDNGNNFSGVNNAFIRIVDKQSREEIIRFNLTDYYANVTSMMVGELYKKNNEWRFSAIGDGIEASLVDLCNRYGVNVD